MYDREEAAKRAEKATRNKVGYCQQWTREIFGAASAGDRDRDGDADAVDGWLSEPKAMRHAGDRNPPRGVPVSFGGGRKGYGHRAVSLGRGRIRSTDMSGYGYRAGHIGTTTIGRIEKSMGVTYLGWSESITGQRIPLPEAFPKTKRGRRVEDSLESLNEALKRSKNKERRSLLQRAIRALKKIKPIR